jgi:hypothetical protein
MENQLKHFIREETLFVGIRKAIQRREELLPRIQEVNEVCGAAIQGPLVHILRFDTPVEGFDSEIGYAVQSAVNTGEVRTHRLRRLHFFSLMHKGPVENLRNTTLKIFEHLNISGLSPELEMMEIYHHFNPSHPEDNEIETCVSYLAWPEIYQEQLIRVLGPDLSAEIWQGGEAITPFTGVDERAAWVGQSLARLKEHANPEEQFDILSRVALVRPIEEINKYKKIYEESGDPNKVIELQNEQLSDTATGGFIDPWWFEDGILHLSKVAMNRKSYDAAKNHDELRKAYCFCGLIREAEAPDVDPIFCYRAAGWARQFWEPILGVEFKRCTITHSILKGDKFCAWDYYLDEPELISGGS